jgi:hypothetical protein
VNFQGRAIDRIEVAISLTNVPAVPIPSLLLLKERTADTTHALVPIVQAITELDATLLLTVHFLDQNRAPLRHPPPNSPMEFGWFRGERSPAVGVAVIGSFV